MLKVTITFPSGVTITLETTEPHKYSEVIASTRDYLSYEEAPLQDDLEITQDIVKDQPPSNGNGHLPNNPQFLEFCQRLAPMGDMRRVVVAAEGARRFLNMDRVSSQELGPLFDFVQWPRPRNFLQTLRNAGRSNFQWLQRAPGNSGYYSVTEQGRREIMPADSKILTTHN